MPCILVRLESPKKTLSNDPHIIFFGRLVVFLLNYRYLWWEVGARWAHRSARGKHRAVDDPTDFSGVRPNLATSALAPWLCSLPVRLPSAPAPSPCSSPSLLRRSRAPSSCAVLVRRPLSGECHVPFLPYSAHCSLSLRRPLKGEGAVLLRRLVRRSLVRRSPLPCPVPSCPPLLSCPVPSVLSRPSLGKPITIIH